MVAFRALRGTCLNTSPPCSFTSVTLAWMHPFTQVSTSGPLHIPFPLLHMLFPWHGSHLHLFQVFAQGHSLHDPAVTILFKLLQWPIHCTPPYPRMAHQPGWLFSSPRALHRADVFCLDSDSACRTWPYEVQNFHLFSSPV